MKRKGGRRSPLVCLDHSCNSLLCSLFKEYGKDKNTRLGHHRCLDFCSLGALVTLKGFWDVFRGEPEANYYSLKKWEFISRQQWFTWSGFEVVYGLACIGMAFLLWKYSERVPEYIERQNEENEDSKSI